MGTTRKTITLTDQQDEWIKAQIEAGRFTNDSEYIRDLIRRDQARDVEIEAIRAELIRGEESGRSLSFDAERFKRHLTAKHAQESALRTPAVTGGEARCRRHLAAYVPRVGVDQAHRDEDDLAAALDQLAENPRLGVSCNHIRPGYRRSRIGRHVVYFRMTDYGIAVIRALHHPQRRRRPRL